MHFALSQFLRKEMKKYLLPVGSQKIAISIGVISIQSITFFFFKKKESQHKLSQFFSLNNFISNLHGILKLAGGFLVNPIIIYQLT